MNFGINRLALLRRCYLKGSIGIRDVSLYYEIRANSKNKGRLFVILEKLEIRGLIIKISEHNWKLSDLGKRLIKEQLNLKTEAE